MVNAMSTVLDKAPVVLRPPRAALKRLVKVAPSDRALADVLGTDNHSIAAWKKGTRRIRHPYVDVLPFMDAVVERLAAAGLEEDDIVYILRQPWPSLGSKPPAEALKEGKLAPVLEAVPMITGRVVAPATEPQEVEMPAWKLELQDELDASLAARVTGEPLYEDFVFIRSLSDAEVSAFAQAARGALATVEDEEAWERFLDPYWVAFTPPPRPAPTVAAPVDDEGVDESELDELKLPIGAMVSARYPRLA
jgi:hypothetical protein